MKIRSYKISDIELIAPLFDEFVLLNKSLSYKQNCREIYIKWLHSVYHDSDNIVLVVEENSSIIGFSVGIIQPNKPLLLPDKVGHIGMFIVHSEFRRRGIGNSLYQELFNWFVTKEVKEIQLTTETNNAVAKKFWNSLGFNTPYEQRSIII